MRVSSNELFSTLKARKKVKGVSIKLLQVARDANAAYVRGDGRV